MILGNSIQTASVRMLAVLTLIWSAAPLAAGEKVWTTSSFLDFTDGSFSDGGVNTYVTAQGEVVLIKLLDLNQDGRVDIIFPNDHDPHERADLFIYWGGGEGYSTQRRSRLPTNGGHDGAVADLDGDGQPELIVANNFNGTRTDLESFIYRGAKGGPKASGRSGLPTRGARAVAVEDLNRDGYQDIVFANSGLDYHVTVDPHNESFIYWGSSDGFSTERRQVLRTVNGRDVKVADLDRDGHLDLVFANEGNTDAEGGAVLYWGTADGDYTRRPAVHLPGDRSSAVEAADLNGDGFPEVVLANAYRLKTREMGMYNIVDTVSVPSSIYWGSANGYSVDSRTLLPTVGASDVAAGDLNRDGHPDLVFANKSGRASYVYWGSADGYGTHRRTAIPTKVPTRCLVEDLNEDGYPELVFSQQGSQSHREPHSYLYWGGPEGYSAEWRAELPTFEATGVQAGDLDGDGSKDLVFVHAADTTHGIPAYIYWGGPDGRFETSRRQLLPSGNGYCSSADINRDGHVDLLFPGVYGPNPGPTIYWGSVSGYSGSNRTTLATGNSFSSRLADFNRDGYLDAVFTQWRPGTEATSLYWGGPEGFSDDNRFIFRIGSIREHTIGDLNRDGWVDVIFSGTLNKVVVFWNSPLGFDNQRTTVLPSRVSVGVEVADLDGNSFLDVIASNLYDKDPAPGKSRSFGGSAEGDTFIYWGGSDGYTESNRTILPSVGNSSAAVADLNGNGFLDLVLSSYHAGYTRSHPSRIYWNGPSGFDPSRKMEIPSNSASGVLANDFDLDGHVDILFGCHSKQGNHRNDAFLYWGGPDGFSTERRTSLPVLGPHHLASDPGHAYDRSHRYDYISPPFDAGSVERFGTITWEGETPFRTGLEFQVRWAATREGLESAAWTGPAGTESYYTQSGSQLPDPGEGTRWIQYKSSLLSPGAANSPVLDSVSISYR